MSCYSNYDISHHYVILHLSIDTFLNQQSVNYQPACPLDLYLDLQSWVILLNLVHTRNLQF